jgi:exodeoxyribonuclease VII small subunit
MNKRHPERSLEELSFEEAFDELEAVVQQLEGGNLPLEEAITLYERGMGLACRCGQALDAAELRVQQLAAVDGQQQLGLFFDDEPPG